MDLNATQAAIRAGYAKENADKEGSRLLSFVEVQANIRKEKLARIERTGITADRVLEEIAAIGFSNIADFVTFGENGVTLKDSDDMERELTRCIAEVSETTGEKSGSIRFKLHNKLKALEDLAEHLGLLDGNGVNVNVAVANVREPTDEEVMAAEKALMGDEE